MAVAGASARPLGQSFNIRRIGNAEQAASEERIKVSVDGAPKFFEQYRTFTSGLKFCAAQRRRP